jgi:transposase
MNRIKTLDQDQSIRTIGMVIGFLSILLTETGAKRAVSAVLLAAGLSCDHVAGLTGLCYKRVRELRLKLEAGESADSLFRVEGGGRNKKIKDIESLVLEEVENGNFHSQQEIADMIADKYGIKVHRSMISRLLKKTASSG